MVSPGFSFPSAKVAVATACLAVLSLAGVHAQEPDEISPKVGPADRAAVLEATTVHRHAKPTNLPNGQPRHEVLFGRHAAATAENGSDGGYGSVRYPGDLSYQGGAVVQETVSHAIYLLPNGSCPITTCWGDPEGFLRDYGKGEMIHITDQYVGDTGNHRYTVGTRAKIPFTPQSAPFTDADMQAVVHAVASALGRTGYGHLYHVFLPQGTDECFTSAFTVCYSPDNNPTFYFCAYHGSVDFKDIGHVLYSVEPFQNVPGCQVRPNTPNGQLIDSTNNVLSHETTETITDPDGTAWWNSTDNGLYGQEIGDECSFITFVNNNVYFDPSNVFLNSKPYAIQPEYDNFRHACTTAP